MKPPGLVLAGCILALAIGSVFSLEWSYGLDDENGPDKWSVRSPACAGKEQSPIAFWLHELEIRAITNEKDRIKLENYDTAVRNATILNNGRTVLVRIPPEYNLLLSGGLLPSKYRLLQLHFHWGDFDNDAGSEHTIGRERFPLELHFVHENVETKQPEAVLGVFFKLVEPSEEEFVNLQIEGIVKHFDQIKYRKTFTQTRDFLRVSELLPQNLDDFIRYDGSFTTPPCTEGIKWTVFRHVQYITKQQLDEFRKLRGKDDNEIVGENYRFVQPLNGRTVSLYTYQHDPNARNHSDPGSSGNSAQGIHFAISSLIMCLFTAFIR